MRLRKNHARWRAPLASSVTAGVSSFCGNVFSERARTLLHEHQNCGKQFNPVMICSECGEPLSAKEVHVHPGPGARPATAAKTKPAKSVKTKARSRAA